MTLAEKLAAAELAYHKLMIGESARVFVDQNGERIEYTPAKVGDLLRYINDLKAQIAGKSATTGPMSVWF